MNYKSLTAVFMILGNFSFTSCQLEVDRCDSGEALPSYVRIVGCTAQPCQLKKGTDAELFMNFTAVAPIDALKAEVIIMVEGVLLYYPLPQPNACQALTDTECPLEINESAQYKLVMPINRFYPEISLRIFLYLLPNNQEDKLVCFAINAQISR